MSSWSSSMSFNSSDEEMNEEKYKNRGERGHMKTKQEGTIYSKTQGSDDVEGQNRRTLIEGYNSDSTGYQESESRYEVPRDSRSWRCDEELILCKSHNERIEDYRDLHFGDTKGIDGEHGYLYGATLDNLLDTSAPRVILSDTSAPGAIPSDTSALGPPIFRASGTPVAYHQGMPLVQPHQYQLGAPIYPTQMSYSYPYYQPICLPPATVMQSPGMGMNANMMSMNANMMSMNANMMSMNANMMCMTANMMSMTANMMATNETMMYIWQYLGGFGMLQPYLLQNACFPTFGGGKYPVVPYQLHQAPPCHVLGFPDTPHSTASPLAYKYGSTSVCNTGVQQYTLQQEEVWVMTPPTTACTASHSNASLANNLVVP